MDTTNFFDAEEEVAETNRNSTFQLNPRDRNFNGHQLLFIGYSFNRHHKLMDGSKDKSMEGSKAKLPTLVDSTPVPHNAEDTAKYAQLEQNFQKLEQDLKAARLTLSKQEASLESKESTVKQLEREKKTMLLEMEAIQQKLQFEAQAKEDAENKIKDMSTVVQETKQAGASTQKQLELECQQLKDKFAQAEKHSEEQQQLFDQLQQSHSRDKALLQLEVTHLQEKLDVTHKDYKSLELQLEQAHYDYAKNETTQMVKEDALNEVESILNDLRKTLSDNEGKWAAERNNFQASISELRSEKSSLESRLLDVQKELKVLDQKYQAANQNSVVDKPAQQVLDAEIAVRKQLAEELSRAHSERATIELELSDSKLKISEMAKQLQTFQTTCQGLEDRLVLQNRRIRSTSSTVDASAAEEIKTKLQAKMDELQRNSVVTGFEVKELQKKCSDLEVQKSALIQSLRGSEAKLAVETQQRKELAAKFASVESEQKSLQSNVSSLTEELQKRSSMQETQENLLQERSKAVTQLEEEVQQWQQRNSTWIRDRSEQQEEITELRKKLNHVLETQIDAEEFARVSDECNELRREIQVTADRFDALQLKHRKVAEENIDLRQLHDNNVLRILELNRKMNEGIASPTSASTEPFGKSRNTIAKVKQYEQKLQHEVARRAALETELSAVKHTKQILEQEIEDLRRSLQHIPERPTSVLSTFNLMRKNSTDSILRNQKRLRPLLFPGTCVYLLLARFLNYYFFHRKRWYSPSSGIHQDSSRASRQEEQV